MEWVIKDDTGHEVFRRKSLSAEAQAEGVDCVFRDCRRLTSEEIRDLGLPEDFAALRDRVSNTNLKLTQIDACRAELDSIYAVTRLLGFYHDVECFLTYTEVCRFLRFLDRIRVPLMEELEAQNRLRFAKKKERRQKVYEMLKTKYFPRREVELVLRSLSRYIANPSYGLLMHSTDTLLQLVKMKQKFEKYPGGAGYSITFTNEDFLTFKDILEMRLEAREFESDQSTKSNEPFEERLQERLKDIVANDDKKILTNQTVRQMIESAVQEWEADGVSGQDIQRRINLFEAEASKIIREEMRQSRREVRI